MKIQIPARSFLVFLAGLSSGLSAFAQGTFQNLDFASANIPPSTANGSFVPITDALPGWSGYLTLELLNTGPAMLRLHRGMPVARAVIWRMDGVTRPAVPHCHYGGPGELASRYAAEFASQIIMNSAGAET